MLLPASTHPDEETKNTQETQTAQGHHKERHKQGCSQKKAAATNHSHKSQPPAAIALIHTKHRSNLPPDGAIAIFGNGWSHYYSIFRIFQLMPIKPPKSKVGQNPRGYYQLRQGCWGAWRCQRGTIPHPMVELVRYYDLVLCLASATGHARSSAAARAQCKPARVANGRQNQTGLRLDCSCIERCPVLRDHSALPCMHVCHRSTTDQICLHMF